MVRVRVRVRVSKLTLTLSLPANQVTITQKGSTVEDTAFGAFADVLRACRPDAV